MYVARHLWFSANNASANGSYHISIISKNFSNQSRVLVNHASEIRKSAHRFT
uniref:Uncharacterized protein n=1 Tax=Arundo donax TaxID=35708 RepID=A0A0A9GS85_ARUDO